MSALPPWHFRTMDRGEINVDPVHDEFFKAQDLADALVRETIQNSLDARRGRSTVRVRFRLATGAAALAADVASHYLRGLGPHIQAAAAHLAVVPPDLEGAMPFLVVEDAGTRGLTGDPGSDPELDDDAGSRNDFYYFWRNVGRSGKGELDRGRWGLGKAVYSVASRIHTLFGLTRRADDDRQLLLGQSVLKTHVIDGQRHSPYGFFAHIGRDGFPNPLDDARTVERFAADFGLQRAEPGLSIVVPFHREEDLQAEGLIRSVVRQYFYPIIRGDLQVTVESSGTEEMLSSKTIDAVIVRHGLDEPLLRLADLTRASLTLTDWIELPPPPPGAPKWRDDVLAEPTRKTLQARFESGEQLGLRIPLPVRRGRKGGTTRTAHFHVIVEKDESLRRGEHHFIRRGITIPEVKSKRDKPVRALLVVDDDALSTFLGDAENPAHSDWSERNDKIRTLYENGPSTLRYVKNAIAHLANLLSAPPAGRAADLLADYFSVAGALPGRDATRGDDGDQKRGETSTPALETRPHQPRMKITQTGGGFTIRGSGNAADIGVVYLAEMAYRTRTGNPFRRYDPFDFHLGDGGVSVAGNGLTFGSIEGNRLAFAPTSADYQLAITGFDRRRDVVVRVTRKESDAPEAELH